MTTTGFDGVGVGVFVAVVVDDFADVFGFEFSSTFCFLFDFSSDSSTGLFLRFSSLIGISVESMEEATEELVEIFVEASVGVGVGFGFVGGVFDVNSMISVVFGFDVATFVAGVVVGVGV